MVSTSYSSQLVLVSLTDTSRLVHGSFLLMVYNLVFVCWFSGLVSLHVSPLRVKFFPCSFIVLLDVFSVGFQSQLFGGLFLLCRGWGSWCGAQIPHSEKIHTLVSLPNCRSPTPWLGCGLFLAKHLLPVLMLSFYSLLWRLCSPSCQISFQRNYSTCRCTFVLSVREGVSLRSSYTAILNPPTQTILIRHLCWQLVSYLLKGIFQKKIVKLFSYTY